MEALAIRNWDKHYETNKTRPLRSLSWLALPVALDNDGYAELMEHENGAAHFGTFVAMLEVGARCVPRGCLLRARDVPHDARSLSRMCRIPAPMVQEAIERLLSIGWLETWHRTGTKWAPVGRDTGDTLHYPTGITGPNREDREYPTGTTGTTGPNPTNTTQQREQGEDGNGKGRAATSDPLTGGPTSPERREQTERLRSQAQKILGPASKGGREA